MDTSELWIDWPEIFTVFLFIAGVIVAFVFRNSVVHYIAALVLGLMAGRLIYHHKTMREIFPWVLIMLGFLAGFLFGSLGTNVVALTILFCFGAWAGFTLFEKKLFPLSKEMVFRP